MIVSMLYGLGFRIFFTLGQRLRLPAVYSEPLLETLPESPVYNHSFANTVMVATASVAYIICSTSLILMNKRIMRDDNFRYPMALTSLGMGFSALVSLVFCQVKKKLKRDI